MTVREDPYLSAYLRRPRIPDTVVVQVPGDQSKTMLPPRRRPRVRKDLDAGPLEAEVGSFALHMAAEGTADAHLVRRQRPRCPRTPQLRPHHARHSLISGTSLAATMTW